MEVNQYLSMFIDESKDHLQAMNENLLSLENQPDDISIVQSIFRSAHTLKGMSATMGFEDLASLTHQMENVLDLVRNLKLSVDSAVLDAIFKSVDSLEAMVQDIIDGGTGKADVTEIVATLKAIESGEHKSGATSSAKTKSESSQGFNLDEYQYSVLKQSIQSDHNVYYIQVEIREDCILKAARAYMVFDALDQNGEIIKSTPTAEDIEQDKFDFTFSVYYVSSLEQAKLEEMIGRVSELKSVAVSPLDEATLDEMARTTDDTAQAEAATPAGAEPAAAEKASASAPAAQTAAKGGQTPVASRTIRVDIDRLDVLMNLFSELLIDRVRLESLAEEIKRQDLVETVEHMARVSSDLQNIVLKLRMVPIESVFNRFPRMVRDLAKSLEKKVDLVITGADTELDRTVIDEIGDPLVHLLRNSLDHGVEPIQDRIKAGKSETGTVHLRAYHSGNHVFIEIEDDGRGIDRERVLKTALKNNVVTPEQANTMSDAEVYMLLFASGFSTADKISDISGRGVGLDVVKSKIVALGGQVTVESKLGKGTCFSVQLPLTLSIIAAMLIRVGEERYAVPLSSIVETAILRKEDIKHVHGMPMMHFRSSVIPLLSLHKVLECPAQLDPDLSEYNIIIVRKGDKQVAIQVDDIIGQQEIVLKTLGKYLSKVFAISGATILGDGQVALIIDPNALVK